MMRKKLQGVAVLAVVLLLGLFTVVSVLPEKQVAKSVKTEVGKVAELQPEAKDSGTAVGNEEAVSGNTSEVGKQAAVPAANKPVKKEQQPVKTSTVASEAVMPKNETIPVVEAAPDTSLPPSTYQPVQPVVVAEVPAVNSDTTTTTDKPVKKKKTTTTQGS